MLTNFICIQIFAEPFQQSKSYLYDRAISKNRKGEIFLQKAAHFTPKHQKQIENFRLKSQTKALNFHLRAWPGYTEKCTHVRNWMNFPDQNKRMCDHERMENQLNTGKSGRIQGDRRECTIWIMGGVGGMWGLNSFSFCFLWIYLLRLQKFISIRAASNNSWYNLEQFDIFLITLSKKSINCLARW